VAVHSKRYFRLNELEKQFGILPDDIRYHVEAKKLHFSFLLPSSHVLIGKTTPKGFVGYASGYYEGLITVSPAISLSLFQKETVKCDAVFLRQATNITRWQTDYPFTMPKPNKLMRDWNAQDLDVAQQQLLTAKPYPKEVASGYAQLADTMDMLISMGDHKKDVTNPFSKVVNKQGALAFDYKPFEFLLSDACLLREDLARLNLIGSDTTSKPQATRLSTQTEGNSSKPNRSINQINDLIKNLIGLYPTKSAAALWKILQEKFEDNDEIDPSSILDEVGDSELYWTDNRGQEKRLAYKTFRNKVSEYK